MPTYQYACTECGHQLEAVQSFSDPALTECPNCSGKLRKVFNSVGIVFKGSGFYRNDSRSAGNGTAPATSDTKAETSSTSSSSDSSSSTSSSATTSTSSTSTSSSSSSTTAKAAAAS
ncbi:FmdB family transcriptional regulator [Actinoplanes sp. TBRC 11911]|uniref:FmdB family zinc ribbon protein n=1 Tax=Actinoplanes sp. TBRC 11911 TaxID=2729386 RepID=UPI00145E82FE|nr:FmdB family zinc ribbon protein [Actinoplanes sp. TBRC 11911]NMO50287.1 FmdB family transcriptional regulator [Actinoplanes sp. TBRC 11911]